MAHTPRLRNRGTARGHRPRVRQGFTLLELTVVLIMVGLIAGMAVPRLNYERYRADAAMRTVRSILQGAQRNAIMRQTNVVVGFNMASGLMEIVEDADNDCTYDNGERITTRPLEDGAKFHVPPVANGTPVSQAVTGPNLCTMRGLPAIQFLRDGATSTDIDAYLTSSRGTTTDYRLVRVTMASGRTEAFRFDGTAWQRTN
ncbi:MAG: prepilin-type N-terminal cleavage/methylation domain-containing protein [Gemmatimonadetes bacterium]|nr:prepilin-type N-terminal cleavage/methylation domain-containing protein [Gemmatimonadota bacterium]